jgi:predicted membrane protein DUF2254
MKDNALGVVRGVLLLAAAMLILSFALLALDVGRAGYDLGDLRVLSVAEARHLTSVFSRASNQLMAIVFTAIAIAVPLTANMYSLKFLEFFLKDRVNAAVLIFVVFTNVNTTVLSYALKDRFVPSTAINLQLDLMIVGGALLFPYVYYVFRFLHPHTLLGRLEREIATHVEAVARRPAQAADRRVPVGEGLEHLASIAIRSIDRLDRSTATEAVLVMERVLRGYWREKPRLPAPWFQAENQTFLSFSSAALDEVRASRGWVEMKLLSQLRQVMSGSIGRMHDVTSAGARALRRLGLEEAARRDPWLRELVMEYFNTLIRAALNARDVRSVFVVFDQYRTFAEALNTDHPDQVLEIAYYFEYYGQVARELGITFVVESAAHDLGALVQHAWTTRAANREALLDRFLAYGTPGTPPVGVKKAQALLASYFLVSGHDEAAARVAGSFEGLDAALLARLRTELLGVKREKYWEVNERRLNMDYVPPAQRERLREFLEGVEARRG